jgi:peptidoglycan/LPS O-acetylase OafA/YrhL
MMTSSATVSVPVRPNELESSRLDYLDATRAFALVLGVVFHASLSFMPFFMGWAVQDVSTSPLVAMFMTVSHSFRMETFFLLAGFFAHLTFHRKGAGDFIRSRAIRIVVPFVIGWFLLRPLLISGWVMGFASMRGDVDIKAGLLGGVQSLSTLPAGIFTGSHLWFLYYLAMITALALVIRGLVRRTGSWSVKLTRGADAAIAWLSKSPLTIPILAIPTAATLWFMPYWSMDTPDRSLWPNVPVLIIYGGFFGLGWLLDRQRELISQLSCLTLPHWILAGVGIAAIILLGAIERDPSHHYYVAAHVAYAGSYALTMWSLVFLTIGVFQKVCVKPNAFVRYVADSSYWMYLIHLPVVIWLQIAVAELPLHWSFKLAFISAATIATALLTYDLFVRSTSIGWVLNGRRLERVVWPRVLKAVRQNSIGEKCSVISSAVYPSTSSQTDPLEHRRSGALQRFSPDRSQRESLT